jgi:photosystem II stability/assembly factor-like uncharacterized protein
MVLLSTTGHGIARAERDPNGAWRVEPALAGVRVNALVVDSSDRAVIWAGAQVGARAGGGGPSRAGAEGGGGPDGGVWRSRDRGRTWRHAGLDGVTVKSLAVDRNDARVVLAGVKPAGLWITRDGGDAWSELTGFRAARRWWWWSPADPPGWVPYVSGVAISPDDPDALVAGVEFGGVHRSVDGGRTWTGHARGADLDCHDLRCHDRDGGWVYEAGGGGPAVSRDGGRTWRHPLEGLAGRYAMACAADPARPEVWYVSAAPMLTWRAPWRMPLAHHDGHAQAAIYRSTGGARWERLGGGLPWPLDHMPYALVTDPDRPGHLYAGLAHGQVWHTGDHGDHWTRLPVDLGGVRHAMALA